MRSAPLFINVMEKGGPSLPPSDHDDLTVQGPSWIGYVSRKMPAAAGAATLGRSVIGEDWLQTQPILLVSDVDSTIIEEEVIDELARLAGVGPAVARITDMAMEGKLDFEQSLRRRVAELAGLPTEAFLEVYSRITVRPGVRELFKWVQAGGGKVALVSGGFVPIVSLLARDLGIDYFEAVNLEEDDGHITGRVLDPVVTAERKKEFLESLRSELGLRTVALGDGANDIPMLREADLGISVCAKETTRAATTNHLDVPRLDVVVGLTGSSLSI